MKEGRAVWALVHGAFAIGIVGLPTIAACSSFTQPPEELAVSTSNTNAAGAPAATGTARPRATTTLAQQKIPDAPPSAKPGALPAPADVKAPPADAKKTASGLAYKVLTPGKGKKHPAATQQVKVHYSGWQSSDGRMFDSSVVRNEPATFGLNQVIKGWTEGVQLMVEGEKTRFWIPGPLAYGDTAMGGRPAGMLVFDVELLEIK